MRAAETFPDVAPDLSDLEALAKGGGPFLSVYLNTEADVDNAAMRSEQRWKALRRRLAESGAPETALTQVDPLIDRAHLSGAVLAVMVDAERVLLTEHLDEPLPRDRGSWSRVPDLVPLIRWRQAQVPYVVALADRGGADLIADRPGASAIERTSGDGEPERKVNPGGWSQPRYQQRAENDWAATATNVAADIAKLAQTVDARIVVLGGDVRATHMIVGDLPAELASRVHVIDQGRAADGSGHARDEEIRRLVATAVAEDTVAVLERFKEEIGQQDLAVGGMAPTIDALNQAAVAVLLVHDDVDDQTAWAGPEPVPLGLQRDDDAIAGHDIHEVRLADAIVRAALATGASVRVIPAAGPVAEGVGALLRWPTPPTT